MLHRTGEHFLNTSARTALLVVGLATVLNSNDAAAAGCISPAFNPPAAFPVGTYPKSLVVGDFNGDSKADVAVANQGDPFGCDTNQICNVVSILIGSGNGTFMAAANHAVGSYPAAIAAGDFNADNKLDLIVANSTDPGTISVCLGNGNGTFQAAVAYGTGVTPGAIAVGDFNKDNRLDLATANYVQSSTASLSVLLGKGDGTFHARTNYGAGNFPESVAVGDFNEDTNPDLTVANSQGISVLLGNGNGTFQTRTTFPAGSTCESVTVGDFNQDSHADIAVVNDTDPGRITVRYGLGDGTFQASTNYATGTYPLSLESSDYNADGKPDFAVVDDTGVSVLLRTTNGTFQTSSGFNAGTFPYALVTGDFNGDGSPDLSASSFTTNGMVSTLLNACGASNPGNSIALKDSARQANGLFRFTITSQAGAVLSVHASSNLTAWSQIAVVTNVTGTMVYTDPASANLSRRFYRVALLEGVAVPGTSVAGITRLADGNIRFTVLGSVGQTSRVLASTNISTTNWITLASVTNTTSSLQFTDSSATNFSRRFYRTVSP